MRTTALRLAAGSGVVLMAGMGLSCTHLPSPAQSRCDALHETPLAHAEITAARFESGGKTFSLPTLIVAHHPFLDLPASCRVELTLKPSPDSDIHTQVWLPAEHWNGKLQGIGNGGFAGSIDPFLLSRSLKGGYAAVMTDTGHQGKDTDGTWALHHPEKIRDYGWRAIHESTVAAKTLVARYYGQPVRHAYFAGGSYGGRTALRLAQQFPADYDGILAGCPAYDGTNSLAIFGWIQKNMLDTPGAWIPPAKLPGITAHVLKACDGLDGVSDGVIDDPRTCRFDPSTLVCTGQESDDCLTPPQADMLRKIYAGPGGSYDGSLHHGYEPGGEAAAHWKQWFTGDKPGTGYASIFGNAFYRYLIHGDPTWDMTRFDFVKDRKAARDVMGPDYDARDPDLSRFAARGGKLIVFHGWNDAAIAPRLSVDYYENVQRTMSAKSAETFMRLYMVPGMEHCIDGPGPNAVGQLPPAGDASPNRSLNAALESWVEAGRAPNAIIAAKYDDDRKGLIAPENTKLLRTRPLCPYPQVARWSGKGSTDDAMNFTCTAPSAPN